MRIILKIKKGVKYYILSIFKLIIAYVMSKITLKFKNYWLISERGFDARDNGYFFFSYMLEHHPDQAVAYIITADSPDFDKIATLGKNRYIFENSIMHGVAYFVCKSLISSQASCCRPKWFLLRKLQKRFNIFQPKGKKVFLQHGITKDYIEWWTKPQSEVDLFICGAYPEYQYISQNFGYTSKEVKYTGFARYDTLINNKSSNKNMILVMPTWRRNMWEYNDDNFINSRYFKTYNSLLNNDKLISYLEKTDTELVFYPHIEVQKRMKYFSTTSSLIKIWGMNDAEVQKLLIDCNMLITDYSSVFFDVAYLEKNILFYQFDYDEYRLEHYPKGYFDYNDGLGDVYANEDDLIQEIIRIHHQPLKSKYKKKIDEFFILRDNHNCDRIYNEVLNMLDMH